MDPLAVETDAALRCPSCRAAWPNTPEFLICPDCLVTTGRQNAKPVSNKYAFDHYAKRWDSDQAARKTAEKKQRLAEFAQIAKADVNREIAQLDASVIDAPLPEQEADQA